MLLLVVGEGCIVARCKGSAGGEEEKGGGGGREKVLMQSSPLSRFPPSDVSIPALSV